jgi:hypothetical protein
MLQKPFLARFDGNHRKMSALMAGLIFLYARAPPATCGCAVPGELVLLSANPCWSGT